MNYKQVLSRNNLTVDKLSGIMGYKTPKSFRYSRAFNKKIKNICVLIEYVESNLINKFKPIIDDVSNKHLSNGK